MADELRPFKVSLPPSSGDVTVDSWMREVTEAINGLPFSIFSTSDGPNNSNVTAPEGFFGLEIGSSSTKFWFKESGSTSTGWSPWDANTMTNFDLRVASGSISGVSGVNKFGRNPDVDAGPEDVWDRDGLWSAPASASIHTVVSSNASDDGNGSGGTYTGAGIVKISGLTNWAGTDSSETVQLSGTSQMVTANSYVIVHRASVISSGASDTNMGDIDIVAQDGSDTSTARITAEKGQTLMAIYGVGGLDDFYVSGWYNDINKSGAAGSADFELIVQTDPDVEASDTEQVKHRLGAQTTGSSNIDHTFSPLFKVPGPAIVKVRCAEVSATNTDVSAGFDGYLVKKTTVL